MSVYVCSDIHGMYDRYCKLLDTINFSDSDKLYILGDVIDRNGVGGIDILQDIIKRPNIELILGNHELFMIDCISYLLDLAEKGLKYDYYYNLECWFSHNNGGRVTYSNFIKLDGNIQEKIFNYLLDSPVIDVITVDNKKFHLSHTGTLKDIKDGTYRMIDLSHRDTFNIVWKSPFTHGKFWLDKNFYNKDLTYIVGHVPVQNIICTVQIYKADNIIDVDCGCADGYDVDSALGCLCLNTMQEYYIR